MAKLQPGDRIAFTVKFLQSTGQQRGEAGFRRGTFLGLDRYVAGMARVRWDDQAACIAARLGQWADDEWVADVVTNGSLVYAGNICAAKGSDSRFAWNNEAAPVSALI